MMSGLRSFLGLCRYAVQAVAGRNQRVRYTARHALAARFARACGGRAYNKDLAWLEDEDFLGVLREYDASIARVKDRPYFLYSMARAAADVPGDTAECGVLRGLGSFLICRANEHKPGHVHHAFDSFEGLSRPMAEDVPRSSRTFRWREHDLAVPLDEVRSGLSRFPGVRYHRGWIPARFPDVADRRFAFVHIDVDLYQPTLDSLEFFYPRVNPGGIILCDDYGYLSCPGAREAFDSFVSDKAEKPVVHVPTGQGFIVVRGTTAA